jgi:hypothetical protein
MKPEVVFAMYHPHPGKEAALREVLTRHLPVLRKLELATDRPDMLLKTKNGIYIEIFEWRSAESADLAHQHPEVAKIWEAIGQVADFSTLSELDELKETFPHFQPVNQ